MDQFYAFLSILHMGDRLGTFSYSEMSWANLHAQLSDQKVP